MAISVNPSYGAAQKDETGSTFKSDDELVDQTRQDVEKHLNDNEDEIRIEQAKPAEEAPQEPQKSAEPPAAAAVPAVNSQPPKEEAAVKQEEVPAAVEPAANNQQATEAPAVKKEEAPVAAVPAANTQQPMEQPAVKQEEAPAVAQPAASDPQSTEGVAIKQEDPPAKPSAVEENKGNVPSDVAPAPMKSEMPSASPSTDAQAKEVNLVLGKGAIITNAMEEPVLKKMDVNKIGASPYYETYEGLRLLKYFTVAQRVEIYQEPRPIDSYILDAYAMRVIYPNTPWNIDSDYRTQLVPIFTRAYGTEVTISDPKNKEGQIRYTHDYREIYKNYWPKYQYQNSTLKKEMWDQNEVLLMHAKDIEPLGWLYTSNVGYRYSTLSAKSDIGFYEVRHTYFGSLSLAPTDKTEYFFQGEYYKSMHLKSTWDSRPDHFLGRTEIRIKSKDYKTMFVPQLSYSKDYYWPFKNTYQKYEIAFRVGRDWTKRLSTTTTVQYVFSDRDEPDNWGPNGYGTNNMNPHKDKAEYISLQNRLSYNVYDRLYLQLGLDFDNGLNWSIFDNWGLLTGLEYYAPGMIRVDVGWRGNHYYNLDDYMSSIYFKFYLFM